MSLKILEKKKLLLERYNLKYNRLWETITGIFLFFITTFLAYYILQYDLRIRLLTTELSLNKVLFFQEIFQKLNLIYVLVLLIIAFIGTILSTILLKTRQEIKKIYEFFEINYNAL